LARTADQFRRTDVTFWGLVALAAAGLALVSANVSALLPGNLFAGLHASRAIAAAVAEPTLAPAELAAIRGELAGLTTALAETRAAGERRDTRFDDLIEQAGAVRGRLDTLEAVLRTPPPQSPAGHVTDGTVTGAIPESEPARAAIADDMPSKTARPAGAGAPPAAEAARPDQPMPQPLIPAPAEAANTPGPAAAATEPQPHAAAPTAVSEVPSAALPDEPAAERSAPSSLGAVRPSAPADHAAAAPVENPAPPVETAIVDPPSVDTPQSPAVPRPAAAPEPGATLPLPRPRPASAARAGHTAAAIPAAGPAAAAPAVAAARSAPVVPAEPAVGIAVGAPVEPARAFAAWQDLAARIGVLLVGTSPVLAENSGGGEVLVAGPIESIATANRLCKEIVAAGIACKPVSYAGARISASGT
jgi:hypothetical protein